MQKIDLLCMIAFFVLVALVNPASSQSQAETPETNSALRAGAWALQFQVDDNFNLGAFQGAVLSAKRHRSDRSALRVGLGLGFDIEDIDGTVTEADTVKATEKRDESSQFIRVDLQYIRYSNPRSPVKLLFGVGPLVSFSNSDTELTREIGSVKVKNESTSWVAGVSGLVGVEWFATSRISFHAEYGVELLYRYTKSSSETVTIGRTSSEQTRHMGDFRARGVLFGLSAYF